MKYLCTVVLQPHFLSGMGTLRKILYCSLEQLPVFYAKIIVAIGLLCTISSHLLDMYFHVYMFIKFPKNSDSQEKRRIELLCELCTTASIQTFCTVTLRYTMGCLEDIGKLKFLSFVIPTGLA